MRYLYIILCTLSIVTMSISVSSCRKAAGIAKKAWTSKGVRTVGRYAGGAILLIGVEELIASDMLDLFKEGNGNPGGEAVIYNINGKNITIEMSVDGLQWHKKSIEADDKITAAGGTKGFVAIHSGDGGYFMLLPGKEYAVSEENGKIIVNEVEKDGDS